MPYAKKRVVYKKRPVARRPPAVPKGRKRIKRKVPRKMPQALQTKARSELLNLLTVPNFLDLQYGDVIAGTYSSNASVGLPCQYFIYNNAAGIPYGSTNPIQMLSIANIITTAAQQDIRFFQTEFNIKHRITNASNFVIKITGYLCQSRFENTNATTRAPLNILGDGFANSGFNPSTTYNLNQGMFIEDLTPFQSTDFCQNYKIRRIKVYKILPGRVAEYNIADKHNHSIRPNRWIYMTSGQTYANGTVLYQQNQHEMFWLFKMTSEQTGDTTAGSSLSLQSAAPKNFNGNNFKI